MSSPTRLFLYGSLRTGEYNHGMLKMSTKIADATIRGFDLYSLGAFPAVVPSSDPTHEVVGEVFDVDPSEFSRIDGMERGAGYTAESVKATWDSDEDSVGDLAPEDHDVLVYIFKDTKWLQDVAEVVPSGDWTKRGEK